MNSSLYKFRKTVRNRVANPLKKPDNAVIARSLTVEEQLDLSLFVNGLSRVGMGISVLCLLVSDFFVSSFLVTSVGIVICGALLYHGGLMMWRKSDQMRDYLMARFDLEEEAPPFSD